MQILKRGLIFAFCLASIPAFAQRHIKISNVQPRRDTAGILVDAHDGRVIEFNGRFYS